MPHSFPDAATMLLAAARYLEDELMPTLDGYHRFKVRVTINVLNTLRRESELLPEQSRAERDRLRALVGHDGPTDDLSRELAAMIRAGKISIDDQSLRDHCRRVLGDALAIANPKWTTR
jgi:hypothetical protein